ncbi:hypothetical protein PV325_004059 [Microctonus aethiopoides]|nr:hypothetical protein PV325_004059 [Microctonus aethiopoides]
MSSNKWCMLLVVATFYISLTLSAPTEIPVEENESTTISSEDSVVTTNIPKVELELKNTIGNIERKNVEVENSSITDYVDESETTTQTSEVGIESDKGLLSTIQTPVAENLSSTKIIDDKDHPTTETAVYITEKPIESSTTSDVDSTIHLVDEIKRSTEILKKDPEENPEVTTKVTEKIDETTTLIPEKSIESSTSSDVDSTTHSDDEIKHSTEIPKESPEVTTKVTEKIDKTTTHIPEELIKSSTTSDVDSTTHSDNEIEHSTEIPKESPEVTTKVTEKIDKSTTQISETTKKSSNSAMTNDPSSTGAATFSKPLNFHLIISASLISYITFLNH